MGSHSKRRLAADVLAGHLSRVAKGDETGIDTLLAAHPDLADELRELHRNWLGIAELSEAFDRQRAAQPAHAPQPPSRPEGSDSPSDLLLERLLRKRDAAARYSHPEEIARGGMGKVLKVWDEELQRELAMKVATSRNALGDSTPDDRSLGRFFEEAQVTGQLVHPGIVPVHELGIGDDGEIYFTMQLVRGRELREIFELVETDSEGWTPTRALGVVLKVCEAMSYAHSKGVLHRDLKPANVMVGRFGEVYVMDWGLARVVGREDRRDIRLQVSAPVTRTIQSIRRDEAEETPDSPLVTMDGAVVGTPAYMAPEQARGDLDQVDQRSDLYSVGAILYHLLTGQRPYVPAGTRATAHTVLAAVLQHAPTPVHELAPHTPAELSAICEKAMERDPRRRYANMADLADDLRAYLEHRVVRAYEAGAVAELRKWVWRNKALAASLAAALLLTLVGSGAVGVVQAAGKRAEEAQRSRAEASAAEAQRNYELAEARADDVLRLSDLHDLRVLEEESQGLWPAWPERIPDYEAWLGRADELLSHLPQHRKTLAEISQRAVDDGSPPRFEDSKTHWWHDQLQKLVAGTEELGDMEFGRIAEIRRRLDRASTLVEESLTGPGVRARWEEAVASIADRAQCPAYAGLRIVPQLGLVPLGRDRQSGLWEFGDVQSGELPQRGRDGRLAMTPESGVVFVLIPGGTFPMGAQSSDPSGQNYDPAAMPNEGPVHDVTLSPFLISKYEMTQGQWRRCTGANPSEYGRDGLVRVAVERPHTWNTDWIASGDDWSPLHPVERVSWHDCVEALNRLGFELPSEAQWEYAARAHTTTPWWTGAEPESLVQAANLADTYARAHGGWDWAGIQEWLDDGYTAHAPVDSMWANDFGLHHVHGNVWEWCRDGFDPNFYTYPPVLDPVGPLETATTRVHRGGGFRDGAARARSSIRVIDTGPVVDGSLGLRPARRLALD